ncbi:helicase-like protein [Ureibacillus xyleni]|uniref:Helicase-like protein n=1 Tax=Ureibacillus xyleni TaxID=614648 RepID=A0A285TU21_9BACL|nr:SNF2-related protein [Ureibacillus xyleni]SOC27584.1 helicase-like protein [Ureibacillus xyleni]
MNRLFDGNLCMDEKTKLFYAILYRRFWYAADVIKRNRFELRDFEKFEINKVSLEEIIKWNLDYFEQFDKRSESPIKLTEWIGKLIDETRDNKFTYDEIVREGKSVFDIFFEMQPLLGVDYVKGQDLPSKQIEENKASLVLDEVGSGKSVAAMYAIANTIDDKKERSARILIVAPSPLKEKWQHDIIRQLGRYSHIVSRGDLEGQYKEDLKSIYFKEKEHCIFIIDSIDIKNKTTMHMWTKNEEPWDLAIIDECHLCNNNYDSIRADKVMLLTATPIVLASNKKEVNLSTYKKQMEGITEEDYSDKEIDPINMRNPNEKSIFVNRFREDFKQTPCKRNISFYLCRRHEDWYTYYREIEQQKGTLVGLHYAQDDDYLISKYNELQQKNIINKLNGKMIMLKYILGLNLTVEEEGYLPNDYQGMNKNRKSYIVFCEHTEVIDYLYDSLKQADGNLVVAKKYADKEIFDEGTCEAGTLIPQLNQQIQEGKQTILITTGQTGGTGLNLGHFDGVIHYELPFTSIQLEQRYGRVDRMDTRTSDEKDMIFLLNACEKKDFFNHNAMLYYCVSKIDKTCKYLPIRNTVLFYPQVIEQVVEHLVEALQNIKKESLFQDSTRMKDLNTAIKNCKETILKLLEDPLFEGWEELLVERESISSEDVLKSVDLLQKLIEQRQGYLATVKEYKRIKQIAQNISQILSNTSLSEELFVLQDVSPEERELKEISEESEDPKNGSDSTDLFSENEEKDWLADFTALITNLQSINPNALNGDGIFYKKGGQLMKDEVQSFRLRNVNSVLS